MGCYPGKHRSRAAATTLPRNMNRRRYPGQARRGGAMAAKVTQLPTQSARTVRSAAEAFLDTI